MVQPDLANEGISIIRWSELSDDEKVRLTDYFAEQVFPVLTPLAVDPAHPFPYISGLSLNLAVTVKDLKSAGEHFARVKVPDNVDRFVRVDRPGISDGIPAFLPLEELIAAHLHVLFPGMEIVEHHAFRVTRNADFEVEEDRDEDLLQALERELARRRFGSPVRLEVSDDMTEHMLELLLRELDVDPADVVQLPGLLDLSSLWQVHGVDRPDLKDRPFVPATHPAFGERETPKSVFFIRVDFSNSVGESVCQAALASVLNTSSQRTSSENRPRPDGTRAICGHFCSRRRRSKSRRLSRLSFHSGRFSDLSRRSSRLVNSRRPVVAWAFSRRHRILAGTLRIR